MRRARLFLIAAAGVALSLAAFSADPPPLEDPFLDALAGRWTLRGTVMGEAVINEMDARWVLGHQFLKLHLRDMASPPQYEAMIFLGREATTGRYIAHWLDVAGAGPSSILGSGTRTANTLVLLFPYPGNTFRDTFTLNRKAGTWTLLVESHPEGKPRSTFASYTATRTKAAARLQKLLRWPYAVPHQCIPAGRTARSPQRNNLFPQRTGRDSPSGLHSPAS